jgi:hypothetical protein
MMTVEPYARDESQLYIEVETWRHLELHDGAVIEQRIQEAYDYVWNDVTRFVESFMP